MEDKEKVIGSLAHWLAAGKLELQFVLPAIEKLTADGAHPKSLLTLLETLQGETDETFASLTRQLRATLRQEALRLYRKRKQGEGVTDYDQSLLGGLSLDVAEEWRFGGDATGAVETAIRTVRALGFLAVNQEKAPRSFRELKWRSSRDLQAAQAAIASQIERLSIPLLKRLENAWPGDMPGRDPVLIDLRNRRAQAWKHCLENACRSLQTEAFALAEADDEAVLAALQARFATAETREQKVQILDGVCSWMTPDIPPALREMTADTWAQDRAMLNLTLRFGQPTLNTWEDWLRWLSRQAGLWESEQQTLARLIQNHAVGLLLILYSQRSDPEPAVLDSLARLLDQSGPPIEPRNLIQAWANVLPVNEQRALLGLPEPLPPPLPPPVIAQTESLLSAQAPVEPPPLPYVGEPAGAAGETPAPPIAVPVEPPALPRPSFWENHLQPLFVENWYIVAGIAMVILGSSLLAYYTWDKHWLVRYTIMPSLLALFTWSLAGVGRWIEKRGNEFKSTAAILRGAAIGLLPINFMAMALLSSDEKVPQKGPALLAMAVIYLSLFGWSLRNWCGAIEPALRNRLAGTLLLLNALVAIGPLTRTVGRLEEPSVLLALEAGFYLGFLVMGWTIVHFTRKILTRQMAEEKRVPWFVAIALAMTFLQVFVWVHGFMRHLPQAHTYALLIILTGWLILYAERRALELRQSPQLHGGESFLGFAFVLLGLLMGFTEPAIRILSFAAAGVVWIDQAFSRRHALHYWIALTFWALGVASVGLLPQFPGPWLPLLGVVSALGFGLGIRLSQMRNQLDLAQACQGMQVVVLFLTTMVAPLVQWHYRSEPLATAGWLVLVAALFAWRSFKDQKIHWLHATMVVMALVLPYAGFMDMAGQTVHHNTMVFGLAILSCLWLGSIWLVQRSEARGDRAEDNQSLPASASTPSELQAPRLLPLLLQARSTVLWFYGTLAVAAMLLRVGLGDVAPSSLWYRDYVDYTGPILMMLALIPATYYSRSLVPAGMAVAIMAVLFPELRADLQQTLPWLAWGSGLASAVCALALVWLCFFLRPWSVLKNLPEGDRFMGREPFPFRRPDHTLFTWPIMAAALFLVLKVDTWNLLQNLADGVPLKTAIALGITGIAWTFLAIYGRERRDAVAAVHLGWICALAGLGLGYWREAHDPYWTWPFLVMGLLLQGLYWLYRFRLETTRPWVKDLLTEPTRRVLLVGSGLLAVVCIACLLYEAPLERVQWLCWFLAAQLIWHAVRTRNLVFGTILFFQIWIVLLASTVPGSGPLAERFSTEHGLTPTLWLLLGIQLLFIVLEKARLHRLFDRLTPLLTPPFVIASGLTVLLGLGGIVDGIHSLALSRVQQVLVLATLLLTARAHVSALILLLGMLLGYAMIHRDLLAALGILEDQLQMLVTPWHAALLGLGMVLLAQAGRWLNQRKKELLAGPFAQPFFAAPSPAWLFCPATIIAGLAALYHTFDPVLRESPPQLWAPYLGTLTFAMVAWFWRQNGFFAGAGFILLLGNIHLVRVFGGEFLRGHGLSELHLICLGLSLTLLQASIVRRCVRVAKAVPPLNLASLGLAASVLVLLSANYFTEPNLAAITSTRFIVSGTLAWLAGWYFRRAARHPGPGEEAHVDLCEGLYHFGVVLAIWCAALLVPWFRQPLFTLVALGLPSAYFYARAEFGTRAGLAEARRYRNSAAVLGFVVLGLYLCKGIFHLVLFPGTPIGTQYYHYNAPLIMLLGLVLLRLHGLGGTSWLAFYGGLALVAGSYFLLTALPGFSPFDYPMPSAWCALGLGHFGILLSYARSPVRTSIQRLAKLDDPSWHSLRHSWGLCLLAATQGAALWGIADYSSNTYMVAPLLVGAASIFIHQWLIRQSVATSERVGEMGVELEQSSSAPPLRRSHALTLYPLMAALELAVALHMDFLIPSYLFKDHVIWAILLIWLGLLAAYSFLSINLARRPSGLAASSPPAPRVSVKAETVGPFALALAALVLAHVVYHHPWSDAGLWGMALGAVLAAWNPQRNRQAANGVEQFCAVLLLGVPAWLVFFSQAPLADHGIAGALESWPILSTTAALFLTGLFARLFPVYWAAGYNAWSRSQFRLFDSTLTWLQTSGPRVHQITLWLTLLIAGAAQIAHYETPFAPREIVLLVLVEAALAVAWFYEGRGRQAMLAYYLMQISAVACCASIRRHLMLTTGFWNYEYDVWASLAFSLALAGAKQVFDLQPRALRVPLLTSLFVLPAIALVWVIVHGLGVNMALLVVGLHSVMFAYLGKDQRESPYNILALAGFVAFILVTFYSKLHLRAIHAYIIPTCLGVLVLQELFRDRIKPEARNWIRLVTLMAMLASSGYYALADSRHAITFNLTMILLCLLAMGLGSFLRIRLYLAMGFAGLMVDLVSILYKVLVQMERSARMTIIGSLVLVIGAMLVFGAIYYKTNKARLDAGLDFWRRKLSQWE